MDFTEKLTKFKKKKSSNKKHADYQRTVDLANEYKAHVSGVGIDEYLKRFAKREDEEMFEQRKRLTNSISQSVASSLQKPFYKVARNKNVKKKFTLKGDKNREEIVQNMISGFYGTNELNTKGLDFWLKNRFIELTFTDPNAFVVIEWEAKPENVPLEPYPYEVNSIDAYDYIFKHGVLNELFTRQSETIIYLDKDGAEKEKVVDAFTLYEIGSSLKVVEYCPKYFEAKGIVIDETRQVTFVENEIHFIATYNETNLDFIPAFRVGYIRDTATDGRTFVNPFESAMPYFRKALKAVSELDLSITLHTFPQKLQYVTKCKGKGTKKCNNGMVSGTQTVCSECKGSGLQIHTSGQDAIYFPLPDTPDEMFDLDKILVYKQPPIDLIKFQDEYVRNLKKDAHLSVYNSNMFIADEAQFAKTATEVNTNTQGIFDTLFPYTEKFSEVWKTAVKVFVRLSGLMTDFELIHIFPTDLEIKTIAVLMAELKLANESEAPSYFRDAILEEIANQVYEGDELGREKHFTRHKFFPFSGKTETEIQFLMASPYVSNFTKVLYANFEAIFTDIEKAVPNFYKLNYNLQWEKLNEFAKPYLDEINSQNEPLRIDFGAIEDPNPEDDKTEQGMSDEEKANQKKIADEKEAEKEF